jgi:prevent-host-death family protein
MSEMPVTAARDHFSDVVNRAAGGETTYLVRHGRRLAAVVPAAMLEELEAAEDATDLADAKAALAEDEPLVTLEQLRAELGLSRRRATA